MKHRIERTALPLNKSLSRRFLPAADGRSWVPVLIFLFASLTALNLRADTWTETKKTVFIIRVDFSDLTGAFLTKPEIETIFNTGASNQILEMSYGKTFVEATASVATVRMPSLKGVYLPNNYNLLHDDARAAFNALGTGINLASYDIVCVLHKGIGMPYVGFAAGTRIWLQGSVTIEPNVVTHEMGHIYGLPHAQAWQSVTVVGPGSSVESGDVFDRMGGVQAVGGHFNMQYKSQLNWLTSAQWTPVSTSGTHRIYRFDHASTTASTSRALRVTKAASPAEYYWVGYRRAIPNNQYLANGAYLIWQQPGSSLSHLLDTTPGSAGGVTDGALLTGRTYSDSTANVHITPIAKGGSGADEWLDITVNVGTFPGNTAPTSGAINGPTTLAARTPATYSVSASDPNSDTLAYFWDFGDGIPAINAASVTHAFPIGGSYTVRVVVSDMKGLSVTQTLAVTVSEPLTQWTARTSGTAANLQDICVGANGAAVPIALAVGVGDGDFGPTATICTSTNGSTWTAAPFLPSGYTQPGYPSDLTGATYDGQRFIACGVGYDPIDYDAAGIWTSTDGAAWTRRYTTVAAPALRAVATNGTTSVVVGDSGRILYSTNGGTTWTVATNTATGAFYSVAWGGGSFVAVGDRFGPGQVFTSPNGITWTNTTSGAGLENPGYNFSRIRYCKDRFLATGFGSKIRHSTDGGASFQSTRSTFENTPGFAFGNGAFLAAGLDNNNADANLVSTEGATWTQLTTTSQNDRNAATFFQNTFITVGQAGSIWQSAISPAQPALPTAITQAATSISSIGATLNGSVNPNGTTSTGYFQWGTTSSYGNTTASVNLGSGTSFVPLSTAITGLTNGVTYHFRAVISNSVAVTYGEDLTFTAQGAPPGPTVTTLAATLVTNTTATLNGSANPNGTATNAFFQWGTTTSYGNTTATVAIGSGTSTVALSAAISGLTPGVTYHYRAVAFSSGGTSSAADLTFTATQPPSVTTSAATLVTNTTATLNGSANPNGTASTGYFQWGTTTSYGNTTASVNIGSGTSAVALSAAISGLTPGVTYHFRAVANSSAGTVNGADFTFTATQPPSVTTLAATLVTNTTATLNGSANPNGTATNGYFQWGTTTSYGNTTASVAIGSGTSAVALSAAISGLTPGVTYHFRAVASSSAGTVNGADFTFTATQPPTVTTLAATLVTNTTATLNGSADPNGTATNGYFQWGTTTSYGNTTASVAIGSGTSAVALSAAISGLTPGVTYHFRAVASSSAGTVNGADFTFTATQPPSVTTLAATLVTNTTATLNGSANPNGTATTGYFQWGTTTSYGNTTASVAIGSGTSAVALSAGISGLTQGLTYHFRAVASSSAGTVFGNDATFTVPVAFTPTARTFTGGDPGEGLDLQGTFAYAVNVGGNGAPGLIGNANFTADNVPGVSITAPGGTLMTIDDWSAPNFGSTTNDDRLEQAMRSIRWTPAPAKLTVSLANLQAGRSYKLQLLFVEQSSNRVFDVKVNGATVLTAFRLLDYGPFGTPLVVTHTFTSLGATALIEFGGAILTGGQDGNPTLSGFTLEDLGGASFTSLTIAPSGSNAVLSWPAPIRGVLQETLNLVSGTWNYSPSGTTNPATVPVIGFVKFYRLALSPTNDDFAGRTLLGATPFTATASNAGATKEAGEPTIAGNIGGRSLWWSWTAPATGTVTISLKGSSFDTLLGVYTGTAINGLTQIAFNDDFDGNQFSQITFAATQNVTYQIAVDGFNNGPGSGAATGIIQMTITP